MKLFKILFLAMPTLIYAGGGIHNTLDVKSEADFKFDYETKATYLAEPKIWEYNPKYEYNKHKTEFRALNLKGKTSFDKIGLILGYELETPYYLHEFDGDNKTGGIRFNIEGDDDSEQRNIRSKYNPNKSYKPNLKLSLDYVKNIKNVGLSLKTKYNALSFYGLEDINQGDLNLGFGVKYSGVKVDTDYKSKNLVDPKSIYIQLSDSTNLAGVDLLGKIKYTKNFDDNYVKNNITDFVSLFEPPHDHGNLNSRQKI